MKAKIRAITSRGNGMGYERRKVKLKQFITAWVNYFKLADMKKLLKRTDQWLRRRIRMVIWKQWKRVKTRYAMLRKLGIVDWVAREGANIRVTGVVPVTRLLPKPTLPTVMSSYTFALEPVERSKPEIQPTVGFINKSLEFGASFA